MPKCQNCKTEFTIYPEDTKFYHRVGVPEPTFCPACRAQRRLSFRVGRVLYKREIEKFDKEVFSCVSPNSPYKVYRQDYWWSDKMDAMKYGQNYDFSKPFFEQLKELMLKVGMPHKFELEAVDSPYSNNAVHIKNCYLTFNIGLSENCAYGVNINYSKDCYDNSDLAKCELCYEGFMLAGCYQTFFSSNCADCQEVIFCSNCINCQKGCSNEFETTYAPDRKEIVYCEKCYNKEVE